MQHCIIPNANKCRMRHLLPVLNLDKRRPETAGDVIASIFVGPFVLDKSLKCHDPSLNPSREISPEAVRGGILDCFLYSSDRKYIMMSYLVWL